MTTLYELIEQIKIKCPEQSDNIDNIKSVIHHKTLYNSAFSPGLVSIISSK